MSDKMPQLNLNNSMIHMFVQGFLKSKNVDEKKSKRILNTVKENLSEIQNNSLKNEKVKNEKVSELS